jgi:hypothetical protein
MDLKVIGTSGGCCDNSNESSNIERYVERLEEHVLSFKEGICSLESVSLVSRSFCQSVRQLYSYSNYLQSQLERRPSCFNSMNGATVQTEV